VYGHVGTANVLDVPTNWKATNGRSVLFIFNIANDVNTVSHSS